MKKPVQLLPGAVIEAAIWADGNETEEQVARFETDLQANLAAMAYEEEVVIGPTTIHEKYPGTDRVPDVPDNIQGENVRLIVGEATVTCFKSKIKIEQYSLAADLDHKDLVRLRKITRKAYARHFPHHAPLTDIECDATIDELGPEAAEEALRQIAKLH